MRLKNKMVARSLQEQKIKVIRLEKINELLEEYNNLKNDGETFEEFILVSKCLFDSKECVEDKRPLFDWEEVREFNLLEVREK